MYNTYLIENHFLFQAETELSLLRCWVQRANGKIFPAGYWAQCLFCCDNLYNFAFGQFYFFSLDIILSISVKPTLVTEGVKRLFFKQRLFFVTVGFHWLAFAVYRLWLSYCSNTNTRQKLYLSHTWIVSAAVPTLKWLPVFSLPSTWCSSTISWILALSSIHQTNQIKTAS